RVIDADNLVLSQPERQFDLKPGAVETVVWEGKMSDPSAPWVAVFVPDNDLNQRREATGAARMPKSVVEIRQ
ncbi:MAG TPA: hypothetical protein PLP04_11095, partial [Bryobacteraceae bacterium]|nr:hypothetical protein [Bryobacteraceae bacterium]